MSIFTKKVDLRSKEAMLDFLQGHFRYEGGYAHNVKLYRLGLPRELEEAAYAALDFPVFWDVLSGAIADFTQVHGDRFSLSSAGRRSGYLVLYETSRKTLEWKSRCLSCSQLNYEAVPAPPALAPSDPSSVAVLQSLGMRFDAATPAWHNRCGRCGAIGKQGRHNLTAPITELRFGKPVVDDQNDLDWMDMDGLRRRVKLVQSFDQCAEDIRSDFILRLKDGIFSTDDLEEVEPERAAA
jgi:hypothetical protein